MIERLKEVTFKMAGKTKQKRKDPFWLDKFNQEYPAFGEMHMEYTYAFTENDKHYFRLAVPLKITRREREDLEAKIGYILDDLEIAEVNDD